ncbi:cadherin-like domain-containing protein [Hymenobacter sp. BT683]|uniref:Cadherin-like domain-containing protein n=1 Tax=Hymenobacter jeongseonensis TaxID=2791027 RepID=A0ABS0ILJ2_9BACT|nr:cadherin-like domain-containing protein [Hymenobacter jeongseonensis]
MAVADNGYTTANTVDLNNVPVAANDTDAEGNATIVASTVALVGTQVGGAFAVNANGTVNFTPTPGFFGTASVGYTVQDEKGATSNQATLSVAVTAPPTAYNDAFSRSYTSTATLNVLANDVANTGTLNSATVFLGDPSGVPAPASRTYTDVASGVVFTANATTGAITFANPAKFEGIATVGYTVKNTANPAASNTAVLTLTLTNTAPVAVADNGYTTANTVALNNIPVAANDTDVDGTSTIVATTVALVAGTEVGGGFAVNADGTVNFTPTSGFFGTASVGYIVQDEKGVTSNQATLSVAVTQVADITTSISASADPVDAGAPLAFTVDFGNNGPGSASGVTRQVQLPVGLGTVTVTASSGTGAYATGSGLVTFTPSAITLATGQHLTATITIASVPGTFTSVTATSTITTTTVQGGSTADNTATVAVVVRPVADVTTTLTGPTTIAAGQPSGNYTVTFKNNGPNAATGVTRTVTLPSGVTGVVRPGGTLSGSTITYAPVGGTMASGQVESFTFSFTAPATTGSGLELTSSIATTSSQGTAGAPDEAKLILTVGQALTGYVYEDPNYGGGLGRPRSASGTRVRPDAIVQLYNASGNFVASTLTNANGLYAFAVASGDYTVRVVNASVTSWRPGAVSTLIPVQTYNGADDRVGGEDPTKVDAGATATTLSALRTATTTAQSIAAVTVSGDITVGPDFGFNFSTIVNTKDSGQGSLRQFIINSNQLTNVGLDQVASSNGGASPSAGRETSIFMISDGQAHAGLRSGLPNQLTEANGVSRAVIRLLSTVTISDAYTSLDATTQTLNVGDTNPGTIGTTEKVGTSATTLTALNRPEVEIAGVSIGTVLAVTGSAGLVRQVAIRGGSAQTISLGTGSTGFLIDEILVGTSAINYAWPGDNTNSANFGINITGAGVVGTVEGSIVSFTGNSGIVVNNETSAGLLTIKDSEFNQNGYTSAGGDAITLGDGVGSGQMLIEKNIFTRPNSSAVQFEIGQTAASIVRNNTIISAGKGGAGTSVDQLEGSAICYLQRNGNRRGAQLDLITNNVIVDTQASAIVVGYGQQNVTISQNSIFNSGAIAIDLNTQSNSYVGGPSVGSETYGSGDGVTINNGDLTTGTALPNRGLDYPVLTSLDVVGSDLIVEGFSRPGALIEFYIPALDRTRFGEGHIFLAAATENSPEDEDAGSGSYGPTAVNGLLQGQDGTASRFRFVLPFGSLTSTKRTDIRNLGLTATATLNNSTSEFSGNVPFAADVVANIAAVTSPVAAGSTGTFNVSFSNIGASGANGVSATVQLPALLQNVQVSGDGSGTYTSSTGLVRYTGIASIARGQVVNSVITFSQPLSGSSVTGTAALVTTTSQNGLTANDTHSATIQTSPQNFDMYTTLAGPSTSGAGQFNTYALTTQNIGLGAAANVVQTVSVPTPVALTHVFVSNGGTYSFAGGTSTFTFPVPASIGAGQLLNNTFSFAAPASGPLNFTALVTPNTLVDGDQQAGNNTATLTTSITAAPDPTKEANLFTTISSNAVNGSALPGALVTYSVTQGNKGPHAATTVGVSVDLSPNIVATGSNFKVNGVGGTQPGGAGTTISFALPAGTAVYDPTTGALALPVMATQAANTTATYTVLAPMPAHGQATITSSVASTTADPVPADNIASTLTTVNNAISADMSTTIVGPASATAAQPLVYTITTTNNGPGLAQSVVQNVAIPAGLVLTGATAVRINGSLPTSTTSTVATYGSGSTAATYNATTGLITIPTANVAGVGTSITNTVGYSVPVNDGNLVNVASVRTTSVDNVPSNNTTQVVTTVQPQADVQVLLDGPATSNVGSPVTYVVTTTNLGPSIVPSQSISVQLPSTLTSNGGVVEVSNNIGEVLSGVYNNSTGIVTLPAILNQSNGIGSAVRFVISFTTPAGSVFSPTARTSVPGTLDPNLGNNEASRSVSVSPATTLPRPDLSTSFVAGTSTSATAGQPVTLVVRTSNASGTATATDVVQDVILTGGLTTTGFTVGGVTGTLQATTGLIEFVLAGGKATYNPSTGLLSIPIGSMTAGASMANTIVLPAPGNNPLAIMAAVYGDQTDATVANNRAYTAFPVSPTVGVQTTVSGPTSAPIGATVTYAVVTRNNGPSDAANVVQTVVLPPGGSSFVISGGGVLSNSNTLVTFPSITTLVPGGAGLITNSISFKMPNTTPSITVTGNVAAIGDNSPGGNNTSSQVTTTQPNSSPVASDVVNALTTPNGNTAVTRLAISPLMATDADGAATVVTYTLTSVPNPASTGTLYLNSTAITSPRTLTASQISQLFFLPKAGYVGNVFFTYTATDDGNGAPAFALTSNEARYTLKVGQDNAAVYTVNDSKGAANAYLSGDEIARVFDYNGGVALSPATAGKNIFSPNPKERTADYASGITDNGVRTAIAGAFTLSSAPTITTLADLNLVFNPITGRITVGPLVTEADRSKLRAGTYTLPITTTDAFGGVTTQNITFVISDFPLPVELTVFTAQAVKNVDAQLSWRTASEKNNAYFDVERSLNGKDFVKIGQVQGQGSTSSATAYALTDAGIGPKAAGLVYYRLRQVDFDGTATYSPVRTVTFTKALASTPAISVFPNPATTATTLDLSQLPTGTYQVSLLDATGRVVLGATLNAGLAHALELQTIASGTYTVLVRGQHGGQIINLTKRLIKE